MLAYIVRVDIGWFILCVFASYYIVYVLVYSHIFAPVRNTLGRADILMALLSCPHCTALWAALLVVAFYIFAQPDNHLLWVIAILGTAGAVSFLYSVSEGK